MTSYPQPRLTETANHADIAITHASRCETFQRFALGGRLDNRHGFALSAQSLNEHMDPVMTALLRAAVRS